SVNAAVATAFVSGTSRRATPTLPSRRKYTARGIVFVCAVVVGEVVVASVDVVGGTVTVVVTALEEPPQPARTNPPAAAAASEAATNSALTPSVCPTRRPSPAQHALNTRANEA